MKIDIGKIVLFAGLLASAGLWAAQPNLDPYAVQVLTYIAINVILAVSLNLVLGDTGQFSLCHAAFMAVGAYTSAILTRLVKGHLVGNAPAVVAETAAVFCIILIAGGLAAALAGFLVGAPSLRLRGDYLAIVTLGFGEMLLVLIRNADFIGGARGMPGIPGYTNLFWALGWMCICVYVVASLVRSTYGSGFLAVREDETAAEACGINTTKYKVSAFVLAAFFAGVAGGLYAHAVRYLGPDAFTFHKSVEILVMVILGGMGSLPGVVSAAVLLTLLNEWLRQLAEYRMVVYALLLVLLMILRPQGLLGGLRRLRPLRKVGP